MNYGNSDQDIIANEEKAIPKNIKRYSVNQLSPHKMYARLPALAYSSVQVDGISESIKVDDH